METDRIFVVGLNHMRAPMICRERAAIAQDELFSIAQHLKTFAHVEEIVVVSTCSRVEITGAADDPLEASTILYDWFGLRAGEEAAPALSIRTGEQAIRHIFRVAAGLDSWIIGESEILRQVKEAYGFALEHGLTRRVLNRVYQKAIAAGKAIRSQTGIQNGIRSIGGAAAVLVNRVFDSVKKGEVLVFGAGQAAEAVVRHLAAKNFNRILVANRNLDHARELAGPWGGTGISLEEGLKRLRDVEVAIFSLGCEKPVLTKEMLRELVSGRSTPLFLIDLGLPRNVESECSQLQDIFLYNLDDLKEVVRSSMDKKAAQKDRAEVLASLAAGECSQGLEKSAVISALEASGASV